MAIALFPPGLHRLDQLGAEPGLIITPAPTESLVNSIFAVDAAVAQVNRQTENWSWKQPLDAQYLGQV